MIADFHFLRPWWLIALSVPVLLVWLSMRSTDLRSQWQGIIAPHLLDSLMIAGKGGSRIQPSWLLATMIVLATLAAAGPAWQRQAPPFVEDTAPLVIAVDLSAEMDAIDITPSRLERAKLKIKDIVAARSGARTALIAYAGSAHLVLPLTDDAALIGTYADALATRIMPVAGKDTPATLKLAHDLLQKDGSSGTILFLTNGVEQQAFAAFKDERQNSTVVLGIGTAEGGPVKTAGGGFLTGSSGDRVFSRLDVDGLKNLHALAGTAVATVTTDDADVRWIALQVRTKFADKLATYGDRWRDAGWWLVLPAALLFALCFRKGWVIRIGATLLAARMLLPSDAMAGDFADAWLTPDQQGRLAFERADYAAAAGHFEDPMWKGAALYRAGNFAAAIDAFAPVDTAESWYDQGNALLHLAKFEQAVTAYGKALKKRKNWPDAQANLAIAETLLKAKKKDQPEEQQPNETPDSVQFDDKGKEGKEGQINIAEQTSEMWMKNIQVSPADLMARKFAIEAKGKTP